jgi:hypothetical protein
MLPMAKARGCSGDVCGIPLRSRMTGLPGPQHGARRVQIAVEHQPTGRQTWVRTDRLLATRCGQRLPSGNIPNTPLQSWLV